MRNEPLTTSATLGRSSDRRETARAAVPAPVVDVVLPVYNEEDVLPALHARLSSTRARFAARAS